MNKENIVLLNGIPFDKKVFYEEFHEIESYKSKKDMCLFSGIADKLHAYVPDEDKYLKNLKKEERELKNAFKAKYGIPFWQVRKRLRWTC